MLLVFETCGLVKDKDHPKGIASNRVFNEYYTTDGRIANGRFFAKNGDKGEPLDHFEVKVTGGGPFGNWLRRAEPPRRRP